MSKYSRRNLLKKALLGVGAVSLSPVIAACAPQATAAPTTVPTAAPTTVPPTSTPLPQASATPLPTGTAAPKPTPTITFTPTPAVPADLIVARGSDPEQLARQAFKALGGMEAFVKKGAKVVVKPNICVAYAQPENAYTTNPFLVGALVKMCMEAGAASVHVMDFPFNGTAANAYVRSGIQDQVKAAGGEMVQMIGYKYAITKVPGKALKSIGIYDEILKADAIINVPIAKHHSSAGLTLAMKNLMGIIDDREAIHLDLGQRIADISTVVKPVINVVDAIRILMRNGPASGTKDDVKQLDTIVVSKDIVAVDAYATTLFGKKSNEMKYVTAGAALNLGRMDIENLRIEEIKVGA